MYVKHDKPLDNTEYTEVHEKLAPVYDTRSNIACGFTAA
jgi:hypothetical protein